MVPGVHLQMEPLKRGWLGGTPELAAAQHLSWCTWPVALRIASVALPPVNTQMHVVMCCWVCSQLASTVRTTKAKKRTCDLKHYPKEQQLANLERQCGMSGNTLEGCT